MTQEGDTAKSGSGATTKPEECSICAMIARSAGTELYGDKSWIAMPSPRRAAWAMLATKRHGDWTWGMTPEEAAGFGPVTAKLAMAVRKVSGASRVYMLGLGENTLHCHFLFIPRMEQMGEEVRAAIRKGGAAVDGAGDYDGAIDSMRKELSR
jgi:diadenosine tetraphosphate (Ap4A) HIT family hydrolase